MPIHTLRLGVELDTFDGHHYISSIASDGPVAMLGLLQLEDELLEVKCEEMVYLFSGFNMIVLLFILADTIANV